MDLQKCGMEKNDLLFFFYVLYVILIHDKLHSNADYITSNTVW